MDRLSAGLRFPVDLKLAGVFVYEGSAMITVTAAEAQGRLAELLESVDEGPVTITREGRQPAVLLLAAELDDLMDARRRNEAAAAFRAWSAEAERRATPEAAALTDEEVNRLVHELR
jgi:antitoxin Phd